MAEYNKTAAELLAKVRSTNPVVHSITNYVVMNSTAKCTPRYGGLPDHGPCS